LRSESPQPPPRRGRKAPNLNTTDYPKLSDTQSVTDACSARPDVAPFARIVGNWVWVEFPGKPDADTLTFLKQTGFHWNRERLAWQHSCGHFARRNRRIDPRTYYGQQPLEYQERDEAPTPRPVRNHVHETMQTFTAA